MILYVSNLESKLNMDISSVLDTGIVATLNHNQPLTLVQRIHLNDPSIVKMLEFHLDLPVTGVIQQMIKNYPTRHYTTRWAEYHSARDALALAIRDGVIDSVRYLFTDQDLQSVANLTGRTWVDPGKTLSATIDYKFMKPNFPLFKSTINKSPVSVATIIILIENLVAIQDVKHLKCVVDYFQLTRALILSCPYGQHYRTSRVRQIIFTRNQSIIDLLLPIMFGFDEREYDMLIEAGVGSIFDKCRHYYHDVETQRRETQTVITSLFSVIRSRSLDMVERFKDYFVAMSPNRYMIRIMIRDYNITFIEYFINMGWDYEIFRWEAYGSNRPMLVNYLNR